MLQSMGLQRVRHDLATQQLQLVYLKNILIICCLYREILLTLIFVFCSCILQACPMYKLILDFLINSFGLSIYAITLLIKHILSPSVSLLGLFLS